MLILFPFSCANIWIFYILWCPLTIIITAFIIKHFLFLPFLVFFLLFCFSLDGKAEFCSWFVYVFLLSVFGCLLLNWKKINILKFDITKEYWCLHVHACLKAWPVYSRRIWLSIYYINILHNTTKGLTLMWICFLKS